MVKRSTLKTNEWKIEGSTRLYEGEIAKKERQEDNFHGEEPVDLGIGTDAEKKRKDDFESPETNHTL